MKYLILLGLVCFIGCTQPLQSASGVKMQSASVTVDSEGKTLEQKNILNKVKVDSDPTVTWHIYILTTDGHLLLKSSSKKVTSSNKRLTPGDAKPYGGVTPVFNIGESQFTTDEIPSEDGTYGSSAEYIYWTDSRGKNHRHFLGLGQIVHIVDHELSNEELQFKTF